MKLEQLNEVKVLNRANDIIILLADKRNATFILNINNYQSKIQDVLDPETYRCVSRDPKGAVVRRTNTLIK